MSYKVELPSWSHRANQPEADQNKFDKYQAAVEDHEHEHIYINKDAFGELPKYLAGPTMSDVDRQATEFEENIVEPKQQAFDARDDIPLPTPD